MSISTASAQVATLSRYRFVAAGGETSITGVDANGNVLTYTVGMEQVYLNGVMLVRGQDYTATTGSSITGLTALVASDVVEVLTFSPFTITNAVDQTLVNAKGDLIVGTADNVVTNLTVGTDGQTLVADSSTSTGLRYQGTIAAGRNFVINGAMDIWQRGATGLGTSTGAYTADRWALGSSSTTVTRDTDVPTSPYFQYSLKMVGTTDNSIIQRVEASNSTLLAGQTVTFSFYAKRTSGTGALDVRFYYPTTADTYGAITQIGSTVVVSASPSSSWTRYSVTAAIGTNITTGLQILINNTGAATTFITGAQLELGSVATAFSRAGGTLQGELAAAMRYYEKSYAQATNPGTATETNTVVSSTNAAAVTTSYLSCALAYKVIKRTSPTITLYDSLGASNKVSRYTIGASTNTGQTGAVANGSDSNSIVYSTGTSNNAGLMFHYTADAEL